MKNYKSLILAAIVLAGSVFASCTKESYWDKADSEGYSLPASSLSYTFAPTDEMTKVQIPIVRTDASSAATLAISGSTSTTADAEYLSFPATVDFAAGQSQAFYEISIQKPFALGQTIKSIVKFDKEFCTVAGTDSTVVNIKLDYTWTSLGMAKFKDSFFWELEGYVESEMFQSDQDPSIFKLADPYTKQNKEESLNHSGVDAGEFFQFKVLEDGETYKNVKNASKGWIYYDDYCTGIYDGGSIYYLYHPSRLRGYESYIPSACVTEFQENGLPATVDLCSFILDQNGSGWLPATGRHVIVFPDVPIFDYKISVKYTGREINATDEEFVKANISLGKDVDFADVVLIEGKNGDDGLAKILAGEDGIIEITEGGEVELPIVDPVAEQTYSIVVAAFAESEAGKEPELVKAAIASFKYVAHGVAAPEWELVGTGDFTYNSCFFSEDEEGTIPFVDEGLELYRFPDSNTYKIAGWCRAGGEFPGGDLFFTIEEDGTVVAEEGLDTGIGAEATGYAAVLADDGSYWGGPSGFIGKDGSINIFLVYYFDDADYTDICGGYEKFELTSTSTKAPSVTKPVFNFRPRENSGDFKFCTSISVEKKFNNVEKVSVKF